jgi:hypothetical protein
MGPQVDPERADDGRPQIDREPMAKLLKNLSISLKDACLGIPQRSIEIEQDGLRRESHSSLQDFESRTMGCSAATDRRTSPTLPLAIIA